MYTIRWQTPQCHKAQPVLVCWHATCIFTQACAQNIWELWSALYTAMPRPGNSTCVLCDGLEVGTCQHCLHSSNHRMIADNDALATALQTHCDLRWHWWTWLLHCCMRQTKYPEAEALLTDQGFLTFVYSDSYWSTELTSNAASGSFRKLACRLSFIQTASRSSNSAWTLDVALWTSCEKGSWLCRPAGSRRYLYALCRLNTSSWNITKHHQAWC